MPDDIDNMGAAELDEAVAKEVMGLAHPHSHIPRFSTEIAEAWDVVEKMKEMLPCAIVIRVESGAASLRIGSVNASICGGAPMHLPYSAAANNPSTAICRAALRAVRAGKGAGR